MKLKKLLATVLIICTVFAFASCGHDPDELAWEGYKDIPFKEFLEKKVAEMTNYDTKVTVSEGWGIGELDEESAEEPYTYRVSCSNEGKVKKYFTFYMDVNAEDLLVVEGGEKSEQRGAVETNFVGWFCEKKSMENLLEELTGLGK